MISIAECMDQAKFKGGGGLSPEEDPENTQAKAATFMMGRDCKRRVNKSKL